MISDFSPFAFDGQTNVLDMLIKCDAARQRWRLFWTHQKDSERTAALVCKELCRLENSHHRAVEKK